MGKQDGRENIKRVLAFVFAVVMVGASCFHFLSPDIYNGFIPDFLPKKTINYIGGIIEFGIGLGIFFEKYRHWATLALLILMMAFLPLHIIDVFRDAPAIKSHTASLIRLPVQFILIYWSWYIHKK